MRTRLLLAIGAVSALASLTLALLVTNSGSDIWSPTASPALVDAARTRILQCVDPTVDSKTRVDAECMSRAITDTVVQYGPVAYNTAFDALRSSEPLLAFYCHQQGHVAGTAAYRKAGSLERALSYRGPACQGAYLHGVFDEWSSSASPDSTQFASAAALCDTATGELGRYYCFEGFGHAAWNVLRDTNASVGLCELSSWIDAREGCLEGIIMQHFAPIVGESGDPEAKIDDIAGLCASLPNWKTPTLQTAGAHGAGSSRSACRRAAVFPFGSPLFAVPTGDDAAYRTGVREYFKRCDALLDRTDPTSGADREFCIVEAGEHNLYYESMDVPRALEWCREVITELQEQCAERVTRSAKDNA